MRRITIEKRKARQPWEMDWPARGVCEEGGLEKRGDRKMGCTFHRWQILFQSWEKKKGIGFTIYKK